MQDRAHGVRGRGPVDGRHDAEGRSHLLRRKARPPGILRNGATNGPTNGNTNGHTHGQDPMRLRRRRRVYDTFSAIPDLSREPVA